jgi:hypothetical protein
MLMGFGAFSCAAPQRNRSLLGKAILRRKPAPRLVDRLSQACGHRPRGGPPSSWQRNQDTEHLFGRQEKTSARLPGRLGARF